MLKDPAILNEFFAPLPVASTCTAESPSMGPSCNNSSNSHSNDNVSPTYLETFTNLERYVQHREGSLTPSDGSTPNSATICEIEPSSSPGVTATKSISTDNRDNQSPLSSSSSTSVHPLETANEYRRRRDKNNIASQRSRRKRQMKFEALKEEEMQLKKRNTELHASVSDLERQVNNLKEIMMKAVTR